MQLDQTTQISGILSFINMIFSFFLVILILRIAIKTKKRLIYVFALFITALTSPWYNSGFGYIYWLFSKEIMNYQIYVLIGTLGIPFILLGWSYIYTDILYPNLKKKFLLCFGIFSLVFYFYLFYFLFFAPNSPVTELIGIRNTPLDIEYKGFILIFILLTFAYAFPTFIHFAIGSMLTKDKKKIQWRGRFLIVASLLFGIGAITDAFILLTPIYLIIIRILILFSMLVFYLGFILPDWLIKILIHNNE